MANAPTMAATKPFTPIRKRVLKYRVVSGAISRPETAPISAASAKLSSAERSVGMPISRAPTRLMAVARSALPTMERPRISSSPSSASVTPSTTSDWPEMAMPPNAQRASTNAGVRAPSAPKNSRPSPTSTPCSATATMSSISTEASASGRKARRYSSGPSGAISTSVVSACRYNNDTGRRPGSNAAGRRPDSSAGRRPGSHTSAQASSGNATHHSRVLGQRTAWPPLPPPPRPRAPARHPHQRASQQRQRHAPQQGARPVDGVAADAAQQFPRQHYGGQRQQQPQRGRNAPPLQHDHGQRAKGHELALGDEDHPGHGKNQHQGQRHQSVDGAIDQAVLHQQQGNLQIHGRMAQGWYFQAPFSILTITRARWSRPRWSVSDMLKMPCAPGTSRSCSSASRRAMRNSTLPGRALPSAAGTAAASSTPASQLCAPKVETLPAPWTAS